MNIEEIATAVADRVLELIPPESPALRKFTPRAAADWLGVSESVLRSALMDRELHGVLEPWRGRPRVLIDRDDLLRWHDHYLASLPAVGDADGLR